MWFLGEVVFVPCLVGAVVAMRELLFVYDVSVLRESEGDDNAGVGAGGDVVP